MSTSRTTSTRWRPAAAPRVLVPHVLVLVLILLGFAGVDAQPANAQCAPFFIPFDQPCSGHGVCEPTNPTNTTFRCVCNEGWTHRGDMFSLPAGADCVTSNTARLVIHIFGYVLHALALMLLMVRMVQLRPFELTGIIKGSSSVKYLVPKRFCLLQLFQSAFAFSFYCLVLLGGQYMHESFAATFCAVAASLFGFWKVALVTAFQVRAALSGVSAISKGANKIISPLERGLYISAIAQEVCAVCFYFGIWGASDYTIKIILFRTEAAVGAASCLSGGILQFYYSTMLIGQLRGHIKSSPKDSDTTPLQLAIQKLNPIRVTSTIIFVVFFFYMILMAIYPTAQTYFYSVLWAFSAFGDLSTLNTMSPAALQPQEGKSPSSTVSSS